MLVEYILYRPIMYDVVLDKLTCYETMNSSAQLTIMCISIFVSTAVPDPLSRSGT